MLNKFIKLSNVRIGARFALLSSNDGLTISLINFCFQDPSSVATKTFGKKSEVGKSIFEQIRKVSFSAAAASKKSPTPTTAATAATWSFHNLEPTEVSSHTCY